MLVAVGTTEAEARWNLHQHRVIYTISQPFPLCNQWLPDTHIPKSTRAELAAAEANLETRDKDYTAEQLHFLGTGWYAAESAYLLGSICQSHCVLPLL
jgi:hypothetical protein